MYQHILVAVDGSPTALTAVAHAARLAGLARARLTAVYVIDAYPFAGVGTDLAYGQEQYLEAATREADTALQAAEAEAGRHGADAATLVVEGHAVHRGIAETALDVGADLIVMGSHGRKGLEKLVLGSVTQRTLGDTRLPVLVVQG